jgi:hypothetical protein
MRRWQRVVLSLAFTAAIVALQCQDYSGIQGDDSVPVTNGWVIGTAVFSLIGSLRLMKIVSDEMNRF